MIHLGQNSGYQAIGLAYHLGASRILLLGYDMQFTDGRSHWHGDHPRGMGNANSVDKWARHFPAMAADLSAEGIEVLNCSRQTALTCFQRATIEDALCRT